MKSWRRSQAVLVSIIVTSLSLVGCSSSVKSLPTNHSEATVGVQKTLPSCADGGPCAAPMGIGEPWKAAPASLVTVLNSMNPEPGPISPTTGYFAWVSRDPKQPSWFEFQIGANSVLSGHYPKYTPGPPFQGIGVAQFIHGSWDPVDGPFKQGGVPMPGVPQSVLVDFGISLDSYVGTPSTTPSSAAYSTLDCQALNQTPHDQLADEVGKPWNLRGCDLSNMDLSYFDFSNSELSGANLSGSNVSGADFEGVDLTFTNVEGVTWNDGATTGLGPGLSYNGASTCPDGYEADASHGMSCVGHLNPND